MNNKPQQLICIRADTNWNRIHRVLFIPGVVIMGLALKLGVVIMGDSDLLGSAPQGNRPFGLCTTEALGPAICFEGLSENQATQSGWYACRQVKDARSASALEQWLTTFAKMPLMPVQHSVMGSTTGMTGWATEACWLRG